MKQFKGTPGPWEIDQFDNVVHGNPDNWSRKETVRVSGIALPGRVTEEYAANTMLVAAAPELLEALQDMVILVKQRAYPQPDKPSSDWGRAEAAQEVINKALGDK